jgi:rhodanese-related sulfurtransferase
LSQSPPIDPTTGLPVGYGYKPEYEVTPREARVQLQGQAIQARPIVLDVRTPPEHETARIDGSVLIPLDQLEQRLDELDEYKGRPIIVHCHHGVRSMKATLLLRAYGHAQARSMAGGIDVWSRDVDPRVPRYERDGAVCRVVK